jgi:hypothetical protein
VSFRVCGFGCLLPLCCCAARAADCTSCGLHPCGGCKRQKCVCVHVK